jgi:hypothetical protein
VALLTYDFRVIHANALSQVLASNERRISQHNARVSRMTGTPVSGGGRASRSTASADARAALSLDRQRSAALMAIHRAEERERLKGERLVAREGMRLDRERSAAAKALDRQRSAALIAQFKASERAEAAAVRQGRAASRAVSGAVTGRIGRSLTGTLSGVGSIAVGALGIGGSIAAGSAIQTQMAEAARASQLANQAGKPEIKGELLREAQGVKGFTGMEALEGLGAFVDVTGDLGAARAMLRDMGDVALATSTDLAELSGAMGTAFIPLADQIADPTERLKALNSVMRATAGMGAVGAVEVKDLASEMAGLAATSAKFKGKAEDNLTTMVAFAQAARQRGGASSAAEAVTSVERFGSDVVTKADTLKKLGVDVFERDKAGVASQLKDAPTILLDVLKSTGGDLGKLGGVFGERSIRAVQGFSPLFTKAEAENAALPAGERLAKGVAGERAVRAELARLKDSSVNKEQIAERAASRLADPDLQFKEAMKKMNAAIGSELIPVITQLIPEFVELLPNITKAARAFGVIGEEILRNPIAGIGQLIAARVALDLAGAGIGAAARGALEASLNAGLGKALGMAGLTVGTLAASVELANLIVSALKVEGETAAKGATAGANAVREKARAELESTGTLTPETRAELEQLSKTEDTTIAKGKEAIKGGFGDSLRRGFNQIFGGEEDLSQGARLGATVSNEQYRQGATETKALLEAATLPPEAAKLFIDMAQAAGVAFKEGVESARPPLNRTDKPAPPVP